ncbi:MAG: hypothetical protein LBC46_01665 [Treponema sp.]|nr:hypothetical protein [Treponema sp.]
MSTISTIFNNTMPSYTAVGGIERGASSGLSAVILNRGGRYPRRTLFQELEKVGFDYIISMEGPQERYDVEELSGRFPQVRFILLKESVSLGEQINLAASELSSSLFFVLWNDLRILHSGGASRMAERLQLGQEELYKNVGQKSAYRRLCTIPLIQNSHFENLPTISAPALFKGTVKTLMFAPEREGQSSLYPFDGVGIYDRLRFIDIGGFDTSLSSTHWQLMDFGFRAYLWGEQISATQLIRLSYDGEPPPEDNTTDESYRRFYLKNLAPIFQGDHASLPLRCFFPYSWRVDGDLFTVWAEFLKARHWIKDYQYRFRSDARAITELWENVGEPTDIERLRGKDLGMTNREKQITSEASIPMTDVSAAVIPTAITPVTKTLPLSVTGQEGHEV